MKESLDEAFRFHPASMAMPTAMAMTGKTLSRFFSEYGMLFVLLLLGAYYSLVTLEEQHPTGAAAGEQLAVQILRQFGPSAQVLIVARDTAEDAAFAGALEKRLLAAGSTLHRKVQGGPADAREALEEIAHSGRRLDAIACNQTTASWAVLENLPARYPPLAGARILRPQSYRWPNFLKPENLLNIANQIAVIAILAIGMTMVILTAGIDLSVGSLIALSAVVTAVCIRDFAGAEQAGSPGMVASSIAGILVCGAMGTVSGIMVTLFSIPAFIATLGMMLVANGLAFLLAEGQSVYQVPPAFVWLGRGADLGLPNAVLLMMILYAVAHVLMTRTPLGRYIYAVGGNQEAARLSGVPVKRVLLFVYTVSGLLAGLGGVVMASQLKSGAPTYGQMYELYVIAAVVVGGSSLSGGEGKILGTLIGAFIIAVIQNGMNLTGVESYTQKVVLGLVILGAVLADKLKRQGWNWARP
jgi:ribose transport system permease protein